jgi:hypothetical protein
MPKAFLFGVKIGNKSRKIRKNLLTAKSIVKIAKTEDRIWGQSKW